VTFSNINDSSPGYSWDAATTAPDPANPNRLVFGFHSGVSPTTWQNTGFSVSTSGFSRLSASDTMCVLISAPEGYFISTITLSQLGTGSQSRLGNARGATNIALNDRAVGGHLFITTPGFTRTFDLAAEQNTVVPLCVSTALFVTAPPSAGSGSLAITATQVLAEVEPLP
jgi:hypothetical protein